MADPLLTEAEALARTRELLAQFDRYPDILSPDEQALAMAIRCLQPILAEMQAESDAVDEEAARGSIVSPEYDRRLRLLGLTARHFLREHAGLLGTER